MVVRNYALVNLTSFSCGCLASKCISQESDRGRISGGDLLRHCTADGEMQGIRIPWCYPAWS